MAAIDSGKGHLSDRTISDGIQPQSRTEYFANQNANPYAESAPIRVARTSSGKLAGASNLRRDSATLSVQ